jgi:hypothetical protein
VAVIILAVPQSIDFASTYLMSTCSAIRISRATEASASALFCRLSVVYPRNGVFNKAGSETDTNAQILIFLLKIGTREEELFRDQRDLRASSAELTTRNLKSSEQTRRNDNK